MCTCLPALRLVLVRAWPRIFGVQRSKVAGRRPGKEPSGSHGHFEPGNSEDPYPSRLCETSSTASSEASADPDLEARQLERQESTSRLAPGESRIGAVTEIELAQRKPIVWYGRHSV